MTHSKGTRSDVFFEIRHGSLTIGIPYDLFKGRTAVPDEEAVERFKGLLRSRYPWLSENALGVIIENARKNREKQIVC
jgi:hypothetical protein